MKVIFFILAFTVLCFAQVSEEATTTADPCEYETGYFYLDGETTCATQVRKWAFYQELGDSLPTDGETTYSVYAGAAKCDINKGTLAGTVTVNWDSHTLSFEGEDTWEAETIHFNLACSPLPKKGAPGQSTLIFDCDGECEDLDFSSATEGTCTTWYLSIHFALKSCPEDTTTTAEPTTTAAPTTAVPTTAPPTTAPPCTNPPTITCQDVFINCCESGDVSAQASSNCADTEIASVTRVMLSQVGACPEESVVVYNYTATDELGNSASCEATLTVEPRNYIVDVNRRQTNGNTSPIFPGWSGLDVTNQNSGSSFGSISIGAPPDTVVFMTEDTSEVYSSVNNQVYRDFISGADGESVTVSISDLPDGLYDVEVYSFFRTQDNPTNFDVVLNGQTYASNVSPITSDPGADVEPTAATSFNFNNPTDDLDTTLVLSPVDANGEAHLNGFKFQCIGAAEPEEDK